MKSLMNILNMDKIVYTQNVLPKHEKKLKSHGGMFEDFDIFQFKALPPPNNSSLKTKQEIRYIQNIPKNEKVILATDDITKYFGDYINDIGYTFPEDKIENILQDSSKVILKLKYHHNRPRPKQMADILGMDLDTTYTDTMETPSYPSGHSTQGILVALILSDQYPELRTTLMDMGKKVSFARLSAKAHYPSDSNFGEELGIALYKHYVKDRSKK
tara:strand:+ start:3665 stop:4309 length:645 start_codon:yes stop_codon:yes gene_type:complete